jgi:superfamily II DNA or RNA helicase
MICNISASYLIDKGFLVPPKIYMLDPNEHTEYKFIRKSFPKIYDQWIVNNELRNRMIVDSTQRLLDLGKSVLITVTRIPHGDILCEMLDKVGVKSIAFIQGEVNGEKRKELLDKVRKKELQVLVGSVVADEGIDLPALGSAIMAGGGKSLIKSLQRVGRTLRPYPSAENNEKKEAIIVDFYDRVRYLTGHSNKRIKIYQSEPRFEVFKHF